MEVGGVHGIRLSDLAEIALADRVLRGQAGSPQDWKEQRDKHSDDADDDQQFDEREGGLAAIQRSWPQRDWAPDSHRYRRARYAHRPFWSEISL
jgi:hypothetical protein